MNLTIRQNVLLEHLNYVIKGISNKNLIPILNCIKLDLSKEGLYLSSTDNEIAIKTFIPQEKIDTIDTCGTIVVYGRYIYDIIRKLPNELIHIEEVVDNKICISTDTSSFHLNCNQVEDFPNLDLEEHKHPLLIPQRAFRNLIMQTAFATSQQESRPVLTGINFKIEDHLLECTATDSYRLSRSSFQLETPVEEKMNIIVPTKNLLELVKMFNDEEGTIELHIFSNKIIFKFQSIVLLSRLINGSYPEVSNLIPESFQLEIKLKLSHFYEAIDRASLFTNESEKNTIKLGSQGDIVTISSNIPEIGNVIEKVSAEKNNDSEIKIAFSAKYMMDALKVMQSEDVLLKFSGEVKPIIINDPVNDNLLQLIVPIRTY